MKKTHGLVRMSGRAACQDPGGGVQGEEWVGTPPLIIRG